MSNLARVSSNSGVRYKLAVLACIGLLAVGAHVMFELAARFAERRLGAYLEKEAYLRLFSPANYVGLGRDRLFIYGPSEAREAFLPEELAPALPGIVPYQNSLTIGTLEDGLVLLNYIESAYGRSAVPDMLLMGITTRFIADIRTEASPLFRGINKYSPTFTVDESQHPPALVARSRIDSLRARFALLGMQPERYQRGIFAIASDLAIKAQPRLAANERLWQPVRAGKYLRGKRWSPESLKKRMAMPAGLWASVHGWDPERDRDRVTRELRLLLDYTSRHGIALYVVNLPEMSWNRMFYEPGRYEAYLDVVRSALGPTPFLDLRTFLEDDDFYDSSHATWQGSIRVSKRVGDFIAERAARRP